jgi:hypothetical protein
MRIGISHGRYEKLKIGTAALVLAMAFSLGVASADLPEAPANSDIALRIVPSPNASRPLDGEQMEDHPVFRLIRRAGAEAFGIEPLRFMDATFEGTVVAAVLSQGKDGGTFADFLKDRELRESWTRNVDEVRSLADDLETDFAETEVGYPEELQTYLDETRYYEPYLSDGVSYEYQRLNDGKDFVLLVSFSEDSSLGQLGPAPVFSSHEGNSNLTPTAEPLSANLVVGAKIREKDELADLLTDMMGDPRDGFWRSEEEIPFVVTIRGDWVVGADKMENLSGFLRSLNGEDEGLSSTPAFQRVARNLDADAPFFLFINTPSLINAAGGSMGKVEQRLASLLGPVGYSVVPGAESQFRIEVFIGIEAPPESQLEAFLAGSDGYSPEQAVDVSNIPWDVSNVVTVDYNNTKALLDSLVALFPEAESEMDMGEDVMLGMLGLDAEAGLDRLVSGSALISFERIDILAMGFESALDEFDSYDPESEDEPKEKNPLIYVPATFAAQVPMESNRTALKRLVEPFLGDPTSKTLFGVEVVTSADGAFSYAVDGDWCYLSGGRTDRLMRHMLEAAHGRKETIGSIDSFSRFVVGNRGRLIGFSHQKVDPVYSMVKGFLLFMGSDFRPLANELGKLRDYHSMGTVVPDGLMLVGEVAQGDGR